jgi:hypothetical protein
MMEFLLAVHLAIPVAGLLFLAIRAEKKKLLSERRKLSQTLLIAARGRRR